MLFTKPPRALMPATLLAAIGALLAGCATSKLASLAEVGKAFPRAEYQIKGRTAYDQAWIDKTTEAEVAAFGFQRPQQRPAELDQGLRAVARPSSPAAPARKPSLLQRLHLRR